MYPAKPYIIITRTLYDKFARQRSKGRSESGGRGQQGRREKNRRKKEPNQQPNRHFQNRIRTERGTTILALAFIRSKQPPRY